MKLMVKKEVRNETFYRAGKNSFFEFIKDKDMASSEVQEASYFWADKFFGSHQRVKFIAHEGDSLKYLSPDGLPIIITKQYMEVPAPMQGNIFSHFTVEQIQNLGANISSGNLQAIQSFYTEHYTLSSGQPKYFNFSIQDGKLWIDHVDEDQKVVHETIEVQSDRAILQMMPS